MAPYLDVYCSIHLSIVLCVKEQFSFQIRLQLKKFVCLAIYINALSASFKKPFKRSGRWHANVGMKKCGAFGSSCVLINTMPIKWGILYKILK